MSSGIFKLRDQLQGLVQGAWTTPQPTYYGSFNGSSQTIYASANSLNIRTNSFTMEGYFYANTLNQNGGLFGASFPAFYVQINTAGRIFVSDGVTDTITALYGNAFQSQAWTHIAVSFDGTTYRVFFNGVLLASSTTLLASNTLTNLYIGESPSNGLYFNGLVSNFRFVKGTALYTANFAPPTGPLTAVANTSLLTLQNATIVDNSTNAFSITNTGSVTTTQSNLVFPNAQKTPAVEYLVVAGGGGPGGGVNNAGGGGGGGGLVQGISTVTSGSSITVTVGGGGSGGSGNGTNGSNSVFGNVTAIGGGGGGNTAALSGGSGGGGGGYYTTPGQGTIGQGYVGGFGQSISLYAAGGGGGAGTNGLSVPSGSGQGGNGGSGIASALSGTITSYSGGGGGGGRDSSGVGGVGGGGTGGGSGNSGETSGTVNTGGGGGGAGGGYNSTTSGGSGIVIISYPDTYNAPSALTGTYTASTSGSGSLNFDGATATRLTLPSSTAFAFGLGAYTIEAWVNLPSYAANQGSIFDSGNATGALDFFIQSTGALGLGQYGVGNVLTSSASAVSLNTWNHVAVVRNSISLNDTKLYVNGSLVATGTDATNWTVTTTPSVGGINLSGYSTSGYISNLRVVKGTAIYTSAFTPSTKPLTSVSGTSLLLNTVSGSQFADSSTNSFVSTVNGSITWNQLSPFATGLGYKNRVYTWTGSGTITF